MASMKRTSGLLIALAVGAPWLLAEDESQQESPAVSATEAAEAGQLFDRSCRGCHVTPDPRFAVDRAWLTQLADTA